MSKSKEDHLERTAHEPRDPSLHSVVLAKITPVGRLVRLLRLQIPQGQPDIEFLPGQWVDTFCPGVAKAGGFTITSAPSKAVSPTGSRSDGDRYIELAVKRSPENPPAAWLWQPPPAVLGQTLQIRVGGSFVFPPPGSSSSSSSSSVVAGTRPPLPRRLVFVAGGVGINPLMSMVSHLGELNKAAAATAGGDGGNEPAPGPEVDFLYAVRREEVEEGGGGNDDDNGDGDEESVADRILFLERLAALFGRGAVRGRLTVFLTDAVGVGAEAGAAPPPPSQVAESSVIACNEMDVPCVRRRITTADLAAAVVRDGDGDDDVHVYVCGVPTMTDAFVAYLTAPPAREEGESGGGLGLPPQRVLFEKWW